MKRIKLFLLTILCTSTLYSQDVEKKSFMDKMAYVAFDSYHTIKEMTLEKKEYIIKRYEFHKSRGSKKPVDDTMEDLVNIGIDESKEYYQIIKMYLEKEYQRYLEQKK